MTCTLEAPPPVATLRLEQLVTARGITVGNLRETTGIPEEDLRRLGAGGAEAVRFSTLVALCGALSCTLDDLIKSTPPVAAPHRQVRFRASERWRVACAVLSVSIGVVLILTTVVSAVNPVDFLVYRYGSAAALTGSNIYASNLTGPMMPDGGLPFTYTPFAALVLSPTTLLPPIVAFALWSVLTMLALAWVIWRCTPDGPHHLRNTLLALTVTAFSIVVASHIIFGQINTFLMVLCLFDVLKRPNGRISRYLPPGLLVGVAAATKLTPALFIVYFLCTKQWRQLRWSITGTGIGTLLAAAIFPEMSWTFLRDTIWHLSDQVDLGGLFATSGNSSVQGALAYLGAPRAIGTLLALLTGGAGLVAARRAYRTRRNELHAAVIVGLTACLASPVSWMHHWVYLVPALLLLGTSPNRRRRAFAVASTLVLIATGPHIGDLLLTSHFEAVWPVAFVFRESLVLIGIAAVTLLSQESSSTRSAPRAPVGSKISVGVLNIARTTASRFR